MKVPEQSVVPLSVISCVKHLFVHGLHSKYLTVNNRNTRAKCEICLKLTIKTPERLFSCPRSTLQTLEQSVKSQRRL